MSWLTPIDRSKEHPLGWWPRLDGAIGRLPGWRILVTMAVFDHYFRFGNWLIVALLTYIVGAIVKAEFWAPLRKEKPAAE